MSFAATTFRPLARRAWGPRATFRDRPFAPALAILTPPDNGSLSATEADDQVLASAVASVTASLAIAQAGDGIAANGSIGVIGSASISGAADGLTASAGDVVTANVVVIEAADGLAANATAPQAGINASLAIVEAADGLSANASIPLPGINASLILIESADGIAGGAGVGISAAAGIALNGDSIVCSGAVAIRCSVAWVENNDACYAASGNVITYSVRAKGHLHLGHVTIGKYR